MSIMSLSFVRLAAAVIMTLGVAGCGRTESYRYKLTLAVNTPAGVKRGSSVVEVMFWNVSIPAKGTTHKLRGEAFYLDLGSGARPLVALLTSQLHPKYGKDTRWTRDAGPDDNLLSRIYGEPPPLDLIEYVSHIARMRGRRAITPGDLPDLVSFADINDPKTVIKVDPNDLQATLGPGVSWNEITLESTDEPVTLGIETKLPWIPEHYVGMLDGDHYRSFEKNALANKLSVADFYQSIDLKRSK